MKGKQLSGEVDRRQGVRQGKAKAVEEEVEELVRREEGW